MRLEDISPVDDGRIHPSWRGYRAWVTRRGFLKRLGAASVGFGLATMGAFPTSRPALANDYLIYNPSGAGCTGYSAGANDDCNGCEHNREYSSTCNTSGSWVGYHKNDGTTYILRPDVCKEYPDNPDTGDEYDGWTWQASNCCVVGANCYTNRKWRCHDGKKKVSGVWKLSICRYVVSTGSACFPC